MILVDLPGMGGSDHPNDFDKESFSMEKCNSYFVDYLEKWRMSMKNSTTITELLGIDSNEDFTNFILCGHSFGGYQVGNYVLKYPQHIKKLILLSPIGIRDEGSNNAIKEMLDDIFYELAAGPYA